MTKPSFSMSWFASVFPLRGCSWLVARLLLLRGAEKRDRRTMCRMFSLLRNSRGQSITEFALVLPLLLVLVGGIVDFGLIFFIGQVIQNAAREGARIAATTPTPGPVSGSGTFPAC